MLFTVLTIFPKIFAPFFDTGIIGRAVRNKIIEADIVDIRNYAEGRHKCVDDRPYGGGCGMIMKPEPLALAIETAQKNHNKSKTIFLTPQGRRFNQKIAEKLALEQKHLIILCGRYEGIDERICADFIDEEFSIGDFVLTGGEIPAMAIIDAVCRLIPGSLGGKDSAEKETFADGLIEHPHYTRPSCFKNRNVPELLLSGNHKKIDEWRLEASLKRTFLKRPDLLAKKKFSEKEVAILKKWCREIERLIAE